MVITRASTLVAILLVPALFAQVRPDEHEALQQTLRDAPPRERMAILLQLTDNTNRPLPTGTQLKAYCEEALALARELDDRRSEAVALKNLANAHYELSNPQAAIDVYYQSLQLSEALGDQSETADTLNELGHIFHFCFFDFRTAAGYYRRALALYERIGDGFGQARSHNNIGEVFKKSGRLEDAATAYLAALTAANALTGPQAGTAKTKILTNLGEVSSRLENFEEARSYFEEARAVAAKDGYKPGLAEAITGLGDIEVAQQRYPEALTHFHEALEFIRKDFNEEKEGAVLRRLGETHSLAGDRANAERHFARALELERAENSTLGVCRTLLRWGQADQRASRLREALAKLEQGLAIAEKNDFPLERQELYRTLAAVHAARGDAARELEFRKRHDEQTSALQLPRTHANVARRLAEYELRRIQEELRRLRREEQRLLLLAIGSVLALVGLTVLLWLSIRRLRRWATGSLSAREHQIAEQQSQLDQLRQRLRELESPRPTERYKSSKLSVEQAQQCLSKLLDVIETEKPYLESELTLEGLAQRLEINRTYLSQILNEHLGKSFNDFINQLRVEAAKELLTRDDGTESSTLEIGFAVGFNSKSSFYNAFRRFTGVTPVEYREQSQGSRLQ
jgi:AraC-like DNA-binding protein